MSDAFLIILAASLVSISCGLLGCYLVLRRMAMVGDAISHAVLPGIVVAFILTESRDSVTMLIGAGILGVFTTFMIEFLHQKAKLQADASIGITFTWLFALGIILVTLFTSQVDIDQECVLHGELIYLPFQGPRTLYALGTILVINLLLIIIGYKELFLTTFDPNYAKSIGISIALWHYLLMGAVSLTTVASFEAVGAILVVALLIAPPATAYLLTQKLKYMLIITTVLGIFIAISGYYLALWIDGSIAGAMATMAGVFFLIAFLFSPTDGIIIKKLNESKTLSLE